MHHSEIPQVSLIGAGAAGTSVALSLRRAGVPIVAVFDINAPRGAKAADACETAPSPTLAEAISAADTVIVAVPDARIADIADEAAAGPHAGHGQIWLHLSGALPAAALSALESELRSVGAFHPAQAFPKGQITPIRPGTVFGTDGDEAALRRTETLARALGCQTVRVPPDRRLLYHAACASASNALLGVVWAAVRTLSESGMDPLASARLLTDLAIGALEQAADKGLSAALTGPIQRGESETVKSHLAALRPYPEAERLYRETARATLRLAAESGRTAPLSLRTLESLLNGD